jgi:hypothetical protein
MSVLHTQMNHIHGQLKERATVADESLPVIKTSEKRNGAKDKELNNQRDGSRNVHQQGWHLFRNVLA